LEPSPALVIGKGLAEKQKIHSRRLRPPRKALLMRAASRPRRPSVFAQRHGVSVGTCRFQKPQKRVCLCEEANAWTRHIGRVLPRFAETLEEFRGRNLCGGNSRLSFVGLFTGFWLSWMPNRSLRGGRSQKRRSDQSSPFMAPQSIQLRGIATTSIR